MSQAPRAQRRQGPLSILQLHGRFDGSAKDARVIRLMNHWGSKARHDILIAEAGADSARTGIAQTVTAHFLDGPAFGPDGGPGRFIALAQLMRHYDLVLSFGWGAIDGVITQRLFGLLMGLPPLIHHEDGTDLQEVGPLGLGSDVYRRFSLSAARALVVPTGHVAHIAIDQWREPATHVKQIPDGIDVAAYAGRGCPARFRASRMMAGGSWARGSRMPRPTCSTSSFTRWRRFRTRCGWSCSMRRARASSCPGAPRPWA